MNAGRGFAVWITGLPASGKSSITAALVKKLKERGVAAAVLESDEMRKILTPEPTYGADERDRFYRALVQIGELLTRSGVNVIFDATANKREYRDQARAAIQKFIEVYVNCPVEVCMERDPKGIYARAAAGRATTVPGLQSSYEPPLKPELLLDCGAPPGAGSDAVMAYLLKLRYI